MKAKTKDNRQYRIVYDLECTCWEDEDFDYNKSEIIEIGAVMFHPKTFDVVDKFNCLITPRLYPKLSAFCTTLTGITQDDLEYSLGAARPVYNSFKGASRAFETWALDCPMYLSWGAFDYRMLAVDYKRAGLKPPPARKFMNGKLLYTYWSGVRASGLGKRYKTDFKIDCPLKQHNALNDSLMTLDLLKHAWSVL